MNGQGTQASRGEGIDRGAFEREGFTLKEGFLSDAEVERIIAELARRVELQLHQAELEFEGGHGSAVQDLSANLLRLEAARPGAQSWIYDEVNRMPALHALAADERLLGVARKLLSDDVAIHPRLNMIMAMPGEELHVAVWHQDGYYGPSNHLTTYVPLQPSGAHNGGLRVAPGMHASGELPHEARDWGVATKFHTLDPELVRAFPSIRQLELEAGDLLAFDRWLPHAADVNPTDEVRFAVTIRYVDLRDPEFAERGWVWQDRAEAGLRALASARPATPGE